MLQDETKFLIFSQVEGFNRHWAGFETVAFVKDKFCQKVLTKNFLEYQCLTVLKHWNQFSGTIDIVCGGFNRGGQEAQSKEWHLWPEMFRIIREVRPRWVVGENVAGSSGEWGYDVLADLEKEPADVYLHIGAWTQTGQGLGCCLLRKPFLRSRRSGETRKWKMQTRQNQTKCRIRFITSYCWLPNNQTVKEQIVKAKERKLTNVGIILKMIPTLHRITRRHRTRLLPIGFWTKPIPNMRSTWIFRPHRQGQVFPWDENGESGLETMPDIKGTRTEEDWIQSLWKCWWVSAIVDTMAPWVSKEETGKGYKNKLRHLVMLLFPIRYSKAIYDIEKRDAKWIYFLWWSEKTNPGK